MTYESFSQFAQTWGLLYFVILFLGVCVYAFWPGNKAKFDRAAALPLAKEDDHGL